MVQWHRPFRQTTAMSTPCWKDRMAKPDPNRLVRPDLNYPLFQENLFNLQKPDHHSAFETLRKLRRMTWPQVLP